jgi:heat shock protein HtpX
VRRAAAANIAKAWLLVGILTAAFAGVGWLLAEVRGASLFAFCALLAGTAVYRYGDRALLGALGARPFALAEDPLLRSTVDRLAAAIGVDPPKLYLLDDGFPRAFSVGRGPRGSAVAVSTGLLRALRPRELEAVLAHELAHVRRRDVLTQTFAVLLAVTLVETSRIGGWLARTLLFVLAPIASAFVHLMLSSSREYAADAYGAALIRSSHDLADGLLRLDSASRLVEFQASPASEPLYTINPFAEEGLVRMFLTHPPLATRVSRLRLAGERTDETTTSRSRGSSSG